MTRRWEPDWMVRPGEILLEVMSEREVTAPALAEQLDMPLTALLDLFSATTPITPEIAANLEQVLGVSSQFWLHLEAQYREHLASRRAK